MLRKYVNHFIELFQELRQKSILGGTMKMRVFGQEFVGQGYMIQSYSSLDHKAFQSSLKREVDFNIGECRGLDEIVLDLQKMLLD